MCFVPFAILAGAFNCARDYGTIGSIIPFALEETPSLYRRMISYDQLTPDPALVIRPTSADRRKPPTTLFRQPDPKVFGRAAAILLGLPDDINLETSFRALAPKNLDISDKDALQTPSDNGPKRISLWGNRMETDTPKRKGRSSYVSNDYSERVAISYNIDAPQNTDGIPDRRNDIEDVYLRYYNGMTVDEHVEMPLGEATLILHDESFDKNNPTVIYVHGFMEAGSQESIEVVVEAYLEARPETNIILLDWFNMAQGSYVINAVPNTEKVGVAAAKEIHKMLKAGLALDKLHIVGHSLGCHVAGYAARELRDSHHTLVKRITALDPAFPGFYPSKPHPQHITASDAEFVDVIHTDAGGYGAPVRTGTADFWPNGGRATQPGCPRFAPVPLSDTNLCSHWRAWQLYAESVRRPDAFVASPAETYRNFRKNSTPGTDAVQMGVDCNVTAHGSYYLMTHSQSPFGRGTDGVHSKKRCAKKLDIGESHLKQHSTTAHRVKRKLSCSECHELTSLVRSFCKEYQ